MVKASVLLILAVCVVQNSFVAATPDFGVDVPIRGSVAVQRTAVRIEERFVELTGHMDFTLVSSYEKLGLLQTQVLFLTQNLTSIGTAFARSLNFATTSNSNLIGTYEPIINLLSQLQTLGVSHITEIIGEIDELVGQFLRLQLEDTFSAIQDSVQNLFGATIQLFAAILTANNPSDINWIFVNYLNRVANVLRANVLPLNYTISSVGENIRESDAFLSRLSGRLELGRTTVANEIQHFKNQVDLLANATLQRIDCVGQEISELEMSVTPLLQTLCGNSEPPVQRTVEQCSLQMSVLSVVYMSTNEWHRVVRTVRRYFDDLMEESGCVQETVGRFSDIYDLGLLLADVTVSQRPYSLYCFHKFAHLIEQLVPRLTDGFAVCFNEEATRLRSLQTSLVHMFMTLVFDVEDLAEHLALCTMLQERDACIAKLTRQYDRLSDQLREKHIAIEKFLLAETTASHERLQLCVFQTEATVFSVNMHQLRSGILACRESGPLEIQSSIDN